MRTKESLTGSIRLAVAHYADLATVSAADAEFGKLDLLQDLIWQPGDRDESTLALYEQMAKACEDELQLIADRMR